jgi:hypothetical protein
MAATTAPLRETAIIAANVAYGVGAGALVALSAMWVAGRGVEVFMMFGMVWPAAWLLSGLLRVWATAPDVDRLFRPAKRLAIAWTPAAWTAFIAGAAASLACILGLAGGFVG